MHVSLFKSIAVTALSLILLAGTATHDDMEGNWNAGMQTDRPPIPFDPAITSTDSKVSGRTEQQELKESPAISYAETGLSAEQLKQGMQRMADYTMELVELMPEDAMDFKPVEELRTWAGQIDHVIFSNYWIARAALGIERPESTPAETREEHIAALKTSFDILMGGMEKLTNNDLRQELSNGRTRLQLILFGNDHHTHTRGIMIMYLRLKGIAPPQFRTY